MNPPAATPGPMTKSTDFKALYRKLDRALGRIERLDDLSKTLESIVGLLIVEFRDELGFRTGRVYQRSGDDFYLCCRVGGGDGAPIGYRVPREYPAHARTLEEGLVIVRRGDPDFDEEIERIIGVDSTFAAISVGEGNSHVLAFTIKGEIHEENILYSLSAVRHVVNLKLAQQELEGVLQEARTIQESLLPAGPPVFPGFDIAGRSRPTEIVGGDLFDYLPLASEMMGIAIADASGHGLPAALLARDVITGLRVSMDANLKVVRMIERLNRVIHRAALSSKFISLFYGEFDRNGTLIYCNAGHNPPLVRHGRQFEELTRGGLVLGPNPNARYERGHVLLRPGDTVVMYTDGLVERGDRRGRLFGLARLKRRLRDLEAAGAQETVDALFAAADAHADGAPQDDDMTIVAVRVL
jgi:sigma-B regulation protein RsbU (phosphoserine phosphatase)